MLEGFIEIIAKTAQNFAGKLPPYWSTTFGHRARLYILDLYRKPEAMASIIAKSYQLGVLGNTAFNPTPQWLKPFK
jgi:hypothetical protein